ncbi:MAG: hypothetical protein ACRDS0_17665 [Pseudonocardiaceae bacterium]
MSGSVKGSGAATAHSGGVAVSGVVFGDITTAGLPVARSAYVQQVQRMAPPELMGRSEELAELEAFCTADGGCRWVWWQAPAWAGKSALMAWFVLHPPEGVRVVSFFITARWPGNNDRAAFVDVVLEQLAEIAGQPVPAFLTEANREAHLLGLLEKAAQACREDGRRLVLVVDGLDEDRGVTVGPDAHSVAAVLPARLPDGVRVVVAGRPNPPIPSDVQPEDHPLHDRGIVRSLAPSEQARVIQADAQRELKQLLHGTPAEQDLLGLVTAAGGGLSGPDLAELTRLPEAEIKDHLRAVSGRTFSSRASGFQPNAGPVVYVLAHEELQNTAVAYLGEVRLAGYRQRLHEWAEHYRDTGWPPGTPEYLLRGYYRLLHAHGDVPHMVACGTDQARHDRMLDIAGGDVAALTEITTIQDLICTQSDPDLTAMLRLSIARERLIDRNANIPITLPATWARLGYSTRAEALARSITDPNRQAQALAELINAVAAAGDPDRAHRLADQAEAIARSLASSDLQARAPDEPNLQARVLAALVKGVAAAGDPDRAEAIAHSITNPETQARVLAALVKGVAAAGDPDRAEAIAHSITNPETQARVLAELVKSVAAAGDPDRAEAIARSITIPYRQGRVLAALVKGVAAAGDPDRAHRLADQAEAIARSITIPYQQGRVLAELVKGVAAASDLDRAEAIADSIADSYWQVRLLAELINAVAAAGDLDRAHRLADQAEAIARSITSPDLQAWALAELVNAVAAAGDPDRAEAIARSITNPETQARVLAELVKGVAAAGDLDRAEAIAHSLTSTHRQARVLTELANTVTAAGDPDRAHRLADQAVAIARSITYPYLQAEVLVELVKGVAAAGDLDRAHRLADQAVAIARSITYPYQQAQVLAELANTVAAASDPDQEETAGPGKARRLLASALRCGSWTTSLNAVARIEPAAVIAAVGDIRRLECFRRPVGWDGSARRGRTPGPDEPAAHAKRAP